MNKEELYLRAEKITGIPKDILIEWDKDGPECESSNLVCQCIIRRCPALNLCYGIELKE